jgi:hypothetical protein
MEPLERRMPTFTGANRDIEVDREDMTAPKVVKLNHDEACFDTGEGRPLPWVEKGHEPMAPKRGQKLMCSGVVSQYGLESRRIIKPGKNSDGYWTNRDLITQIREDGPALVLKYPGCLLLWVFDCSANHKMYAPNALIASRLNLGDGFPKRTASDIAAEIAPVAFRDTTWVDSLGVAHVQSFSIKDDAGIIIGHKGIYTILKERDLWRDKQTVELPICRLLPGFEGPINNKKRLITVVEKMLLPEALALLEMQPDFLGQKEKCWVTETVESLGMLSIAKFLPPFHCIFAEIEMLWGCAKRYTRAHCDYSLEGLISTVPLALESVSLCTIRRHFEHVTRYMKAYRMGTLSPAQVEWAMRKYTSHRRIKEADIDELEKDFLRPTYFKDMPKDLSD